MRSLFDEIETQFEHLTAEQRFLRFHRSNPHVYRTLVGLAWQWVNSTGRRKIGVAALFERARWEIAVETNDPEFKLNNTHRAFYARAIMRNEPGLEDIFDLRRSAADDADLDGIAA